MLFFFWLLNFLSDWISHTPKKKSSSTLFIFTQYARGKNIVLLVFFFSKGKRRGERVSQEGCGTWILDCVVWKRGPFHLHLRLRNGIASPNVRYALFKQEWVGIVTYLFFWKMNCGYQMTAVKNEIQQLKYPLPVSVNPRSNVRTPTPNIQSPSKSKAITTLKGPTRFFKIRAIIVRTNDTTPQATAQAGSFSHLEENQIKSKQIHTRLEALTPRHTHTHTHNEGGEKRNNIGPQKKTILVDIHVIAHHIRTQHSSSCHFDRRREEKHP